MILPQICGALAAHFMSFIESLRAINIMTIFKYFLKGIHAFQCLQKSHIIKMEFKLLIKMK